MKLKATLVALVLAAVIAVASLGGGMFDGHKTAGWAWDKHPTAGTVIVLAHDDGFADGNG